MSMEDFGIPFFEGFPFAYAWKTTRVTVKFGLETQATASTAHNLPDANDIEETPDEVLAAKEHALWRVCLAALIENRMYRMPYHRNSFVRVFSLERSGDDGGCA